MTEIPVDRIPSEEEIEEFKKDAEIFEELVDVLLPFVVQRSHRDRDQVRKVLWADLNRLLLKFLAGEFENRALYERVREMAFERGTDGRHSGSSNQFKIDDMKRHIFRSFFRELMQEGENSFSRAQVRKMSRMTIPYLQSFTQSYKPDDNTKKQKGRK